MGDHWHCFIKARSTLAIGNVHHCIRWYNKKAEQNIISIPGLSFTRRTSRCLFCTALAENNSTMGAPYVSSHFRGIKDGKVRVAHGQD